MGISTTDALLRFARRWFDERTVSSVFEPLLADHQRVWLDAAPAERTRITFRTAAALVAAMLLTAPRAIALAPMPESTARRALSRMIIFTATVSTLLTIPVLLDAREMTVPETIVAGLFILPAGIAIAFPFSMLWVTDAIRRSRVATSAERAAALRVASAAVVFMVALVGWGVPAMNQLYREVAAPEWARPPGRGVREATLGELLSKQPPRLQEVRSPAALRREANNRAVISLLPAILVWLRWGALAAQRKRWWSSPPVAVETLVAIAVFFPLYFSGFMMEVRLGLPPGAGMWLPIATLITAGVIRNAIARRVDA